MDDAPHLYPPSCFPLSSSLYVWLRRRIIWESKEGRLLPSFHLSSHLLASNFLVWTQNCCGSVNHLLTLSPFS
ncbi:hypothetical protein B296_00043286 [Ensete ventricosum]|uniref:Uncharacterized protein n=1 Tax=Ensete ventricosum TaxID=4639 RepID=A0A426Z377_ENSVE|nr:hypothetical protein B296_00043286 [Ensete ventricosum]